MRRISTALCTMGLLIAGRTAIAQQPSAEGAPTAALTVAPVALAVVEAQSDATLRATARDLTEQLGRALGEDATVHVVMPGATPVAKASRETLPAYRLEAVLDRAGREQLVLTWRLIGPGDEELMTGRERVVRGEEAATANAVARTVLKRVHSR